MPSTPKSPIGLYVPGGKRGFQCLKISVNTEYDRVLIMGCSKVNPICRDGKSPQIFLTTGAAKDTSGARISIGFNNRGL